MEEKTKFLIIIAVVILLVIVFAVVVILIVLFRNKNTSNLPFNNKNIVFVIPQNGGTNGGYLSTCHDPTDFQVYPVISTSRLINPDFYWQTIIGTDRSTFQLANYQSQKDGEFGYLSNTMNGLIIAKDDSTKDTWFSLEEQGLATGLYKIKSIVDGRYLSIAANIYSCSQNRVGLQGSDQASVFKFKITLLS